MAKAISTDQLIEENGKRITTPFLKRAKKKRKMRNPNVELGDLVTLEWGETGIVSEIEKREYVGGDFFVTTVVTENGTKIQPQSHEIAKITKRKNVPVEMYLGNKYRSWRVRAFGYEKRSLMEGVPLLLDRVEIVMGGLDLWLDNGDVYRLGGHIISHGFDLQKRERNFELLVDARTNLSISEALCEKFSLELTIRQVDIARIERVLDSDLAEFLTHEESVLRELAHDIHTGKQIRTSMEGW